jgi:hypothetical protein
MPNEHRASMEQETRENGLNRKPHHLRLQHQLRGSFTTVYLTTVSIIQGVVLADLAGVTASGYEHFTVLQWLMVPINFFLIITVWNHYMTDSIAMEWIPGFSDSVFPFSFGAIELFLNHTIFLGLTAWLAGWAVFAAVGAVGTRFLMWKAKQETTNPQFLQLFLNRQAGYIWKSLTGLVLFLLLALSSAVGHIGATNEEGGMQRAFAIGSVVVVALWVGLIAFHAIRYWHDLMEYTRTGQLPRSAGANLPPETTR